MARGRLRCVGSALWLKARFGLGYRLVVTTTRAIGQAVEGFTGKSSPSRHGKKQRFVEAPVATAVVPAIHGTAVPGAASAHSSPAAAVERLVDSSAREEHEGAEELGGSDETDEFGIFSPPNNEKLLAHSNSLFAGTPKEKRQDGKEASSFFSSSSEKAAPGVAHAAAAAGAVATAEGAVRRSVQSAIPAARFAGAVAREVSFRLPRASAPQFPGLLEQLDAMPEHVSAYSLAVTSLEEVFVQVAEEDEKDRARSSGAASNTGSISGTSGSNSNAAAVEMTSYAPNKSTMELNEQNGPAEEAKYDASEGQQYDYEGGEDEEEDDKFAETNDEERSQIELGFSEEIAIQFFKRWTVFKRDRKGAFFQLGVPILLIAGILSILTIRVTVRSISNFIKHQL